MNRELEVSRIDTDVFLVCQSATRETHQVADAWRLVAPRRRRIDDSGAPLALIVLGFPIDEAVSDSAVLLEARGVPQVRLVGWVMANSVPRDYWSKGFPIDHTSYLGTLIAGEGGILYRPLRDGHAFSVNTLDASLEG